MTKSPSPLFTEFMFQVLGESTRAMTIWVIRGDEGVGAFPGILGDSGGRGLQVLRNETRLTQELRLKV